VLEKTVHQISNISRCDLCAIRHSAICNALDREEIKTLNKMAMRRTIPSGKMILREGEARTVFANVVSGVVKLTKTLDDGRQHIIGLLFPSDFLGRTFREDNPYFAEAATEVELCIFPADEFERFLRSQPGLEHRLFQYTLSELDACQDWMLLLARKRAEERVASFLLMIAKRLPHLRCCGSPAKAAEPSFLLPLSRGEIADCLGLTIETVSRQLTRLKNQGIIGLQSNREISLPNLDRLREIAHQDSRV
jgi:CRP/FNR family transcriptional regulator